MLMATEGFRRAAVWNGAGEERGERGRRMPTGYLGIFFYVCICMHMYAHACSMRPDTNTCLAIIMLAHRSRFTSTCEGPFKFYPGEVGLYLLPKVLPRTFMMHG